MNRKIYTLSLLLFLSLSIYAQDGIIRGTVIEDATGEPLFGVTAAIKGTTNGAITDFDGKFQINVEPGTYALEFSFVSFQKLVIEGLEVKSGEVALLNNIRLKEDVQQLQEVVVTAEVIRTTEVALLTVKRKSANLLDGISSESFRRIGDSDAAGAIKRVTGVSVEGGKYVYVRGLGDRYTKTTLNSVDIPGLDPDRNSLQIDIFPTNLINTMIVLKTSLAELPADFTGGVVNIETKDFPEEKIAEVSAGISFNPSMHFNGDFLNPQVGSTDWLGYDDGLRELPKGADNASIPTPINPDFSDEEVNSFVKEFNPTLGGATESVFMDYSFGLTLGNQRTLSNGNQLGYIFSGTYRSSRLFYDDVVYGEYQRPGGSNEFELVPAVVQSGGLGSQNVLLGGLGGLAYKTSRAKYRLTLMHLQNAENAAGNFFVDDNGQAVGKSGFTADSYNLAYNQRGITNIMLHGEHHLSDNKWELNWRLSPTRSTLSDPDIRRTAFTLNNADPRFDPGNGGNPSRIWRELDEINLVGKVDVINRYELFGEDAKFKFGVNYVYKDRDYSILFFDLQRFGAAPLLSGDPNEVLIPENIYPDGVYYYQSGNSFPNTNEYAANSTTLAGYVSNEFNPLPKLKTIVGLRVEQYTQRHTGRDVDFATTGTGRNLDNEEVLDAVDLFPSVNAIYALGEKQNIRASYSRTISRPSFKELSFAQILDPITNRTFIGSLSVVEDADGTISWDGNLSETRIENFDLRWELFGKGEQLFSVSAFYKTFDKPIELVRLPVSQTGLQFQSRNVGDGELYGVELEVRKNLGFITTGLDNVTFSTNVTFVESIITMTDVEFDARKVFEKDGETIDREREMGGQAPYVINAGFSYQNSTANFDAGFFYNVKGPTLTIVGGGLTPDVFSEPFHSLNFNANKTLGKEQRVTLNFSVTNILDDVREEFYTGFNAEDQLFNRFGPRRSFGFGINYALN